MNLVGYSYCVKTIIAVFGLAVPQSDVELNKAQENLWTHCDCFLRVKEMQTSEASVKGLHSWGKAVWLHTADGPL